MDPVVVALAGTLAFVYQPQPQRHGWYKLPAQQCEELQRVFFRPVNQQDYPIRWGSDIEGWYGTNSPEKISCLVKE